MIDVVMGERQGRVGVGVVFKRYEHEICRTGGQEREVLAGGWQDRW